MGATKLRLLARFNGRIKTRSLYLVAVFLLLHRWFSESPSNRYTNVPMLRCSDVSIIRVMRCKGVQQYARLIPGIYQLVYIYLETIKMFVLLCNNVLFVSTSFNSTFVCKI